MHAVDADGRTELSLTRTDGAVRIVIMQTVVHDSYPYKDAILWGGDVGELPKTIVTSIQVRIGTEEIFIPLSAYSDLGNVKFASIDSADHGFTLRIHGGDGATSYDAALAFKRTYLISREVALREFPKERRDATSYSFPARVKD
jgi:hypothetical protein